MLRTTTERVLGGEKRQAPLALPSGSPESAQPWAPLGAVTAAREFLLLHLSATVQQLQALLMLVHVECPGCNRCIVTATFPLKKLNSHLHQNRRLSFLLIESLPPNWS